MDQQYFQIVCLNGHQKTDYSTYPIVSTEYCEDCGQQLTSSCKNCEAPILGYLSISGVISTANKPVPNYCRKCATPYPWTSTIIENATELIALDGNLSSEAREVIKNAIPDLLIETPKTQVAVAKYKISIKNASTLVKDAMYNLLVDVTSETVKKALFNG